MMPYAPTERYTGAHRGVTYTNTEPYLFLRRLGVKQWERLDMLTAATQAQLKRPAYKLRTLIYDVSHLLLTSQVFPSHDLIAISWEHADTVSPRRISVTFPHIDPPAFDTLIRNRGYTDRSHYTRCVAAWILVNRCSFKLDENGLSVPRYNTP